MQAICPVPRPAARARFAEGFGQRFIVTVDTEEEFDWSAPFSRNGHGLNHVPRLAKFQSFCESLGVAPVYLVDWPIAMSALAADILRPAVAAGKAEVGVQLHPWVNPPFDEEVSERNSFAGNLPRDLEAAKLGNLRDRIEEAFGVAPVVYRAGRYGTGPYTAEILRANGIAIDTSVRSNFDYSAGEGPDYSGFPLEPFWIDRERTLLELPVTTVWWGLLRRQGSALFRAARKVPMVPGLLARLGLLERIALTPEGVGTDEAIRGIDIAIDDGLPLLVFSFHSPSLQPGCTPYVRDEAALDRLYDWWRRVFDYCAMRGVRPTSLAEVMHAVER